MNKQPFYYEIEIRLIFTATRELNEDEIKERVAVKFKGTEGVLRGSQEVHIDKIEGEPGDPADLL